MRRRTAWPRWSSGRSTLPRTVSLVVAQGQIAGADVGRRDAESQHAVGACGDSALDCRAVVRCEVLVADDPVVLQELVSAPTAGHTLTCEAIAWQDTTGEIPAVPRVPPPAAQSFLAAITRSRGHG